ncbi:MAG: riboflavin synthase [Bacteroidota bacterium]|jgi:riboflavin synthase|nr:riboflavin synthase [Bacteroidota bacterium]
MFTGLIEEVGTLRAVQQLGNGRRFDIAASSVLDGTAVGDSIAVNGVCLTVTRYTRERFTVEAVEETVRKSTLGEFSVGDSVNLERALRADGKLGGHFVQGHVDFATTLVAIERRAESWMVAFSFPAEAAPFIIPMGSISIDGVSLTVAERSDDAFRVSVIPHTWNATLFRTYGRGRRVNIELDMIGKYVVNYLRGSGATGITEGFLRNLGY